MILKIIDLIFFNKEFIRIKMYEGEYFFIVIISIFNLLL